MSLQNDIPLQDLEEFGLESGLSTTKSESSRYRQIKNIAGSPNLVQRIKSSRLARKFTAPSTWPLLKILRRLFYLSLVILSLVLCLVYVIKSIKRKKEIRFTDQIDFLNPKDRRLRRKNLSTKLDSPFEIGCREPDVNGPRANASFVMLSRNSELDDVVSSMKSMERHFNQWFNYPWVFLNDVEFDDTFKETVRKHTNAEVEFGVVPKEHWEFPESVDRMELAEAIESQGDRKILYGNMESYHKMCRFYSGHFYDHPLVRKREWYWRVEPDVDFYCDMTYDPFIEMEKHNKVYGFTVTIEELYYTAPSLFLETKAFIEKKKIKVQSAWDFVAKKYNHVIGKNADMYRNWRDFNDLVKQAEKNINLKKLLLVENKTDEDLERIKDFKNVRDIFELALDMPPLHDDRVDNEEYNLCHFWSNFEIARTDIFLSKTYQDYFKHLEESGGFYKERWGDAPVHSLAVAMMLPKEQLHYFRDVGYRHSTLVHCPFNAPDKQLPYQSNGFPEDAPGPWYRTFFQSNEPDEPFKNGVGCRCKCPPKLRDLEDFNSVCIRRYARIMSDDFRPNIAIDMDKIEAGVTKKIDRKLAKGRKIGE